MTHTERTEQWIEEIADMVYENEIAGGWSDACDHIEGVALHLAAKLDRMNERIRHNSSRGIDMDVRDDLIAILEGD